MIEFSKIMIMFQKEGYTFKWHNYVCLTGYYIHTALICAYVR